MLPVVLYECETWSLTLREECRLRVFENRVLRRIFAYTRGKVTGEWRKLHNEKCCLVNKIEKNKVVGACITNGEEERRIQGVRGET